MTILEGDLQKIRLPKVLLAVASQKSNGILTVQGAEDIVAVSFVQGAIVTADALNQTVEDGLGKVLQGKGLISSDAFEAAVRDYQGGATGSLGELLVERNLIGRKDLLEALRLQTFRSMLQLLTWKYGDFKFYSGDEVSFEEGFAPIGVDELLLRAVDKLGEKAGMLGALPNLETVYRPVPPRSAIQVMGRDGDGLAAGIWIAPWHSDFLGQVDGQRTAAEIARSLGMDRYRALFSIYHLTQHDLVEGSGRASGAPSLDSTAPWAPAPGAARPSAAQHGQGQHGQGQHGQDQYGQGRAAGPAAVGPGAGGPAAGAPAAAGPSPGGTIPFAEPSSAGQPRPGAAGRGPSPFADDFGDFLDSPSGGGQPAGELGRQPVAAQWLEESEAGATRTRPAPATGAWLLDWGGPGLAALLLVAIGFTVLDRPVSLLLPFSWQENARSTVERQVRESLYQRIDRSARTYFLMEAHYPDTLEVLRQRGMVSAADLRDPAGYELDYSPEAVSYRIQLQRNNSSVEGLGTTEAITGDFLVDPQFLGSAATAEAPLVLLD